MLTTGKSIPDYPIALAGSFGVAEHFLALHLLHLNGKFDGVATRTG
jgi:hypothetical protein